jgi:hypothetical protein
MEWLDAAVDEAASGFGVAQGFEHLGGDIEIDVVAAAGEDDVQVAPLRIVVGADDRCTVGLERDHRSETMGGEGGCTDSPDRSSS